MKLENKIQDSTIKGFFIVMVILFILMQIAFHPSYLQFFPQFHEFSWIHHIHGALMVSWMVMLIIQPYLIIKNNYKTHRLIGKISYFTAPLVFISMILITKLNYLKMVDVMPFKDAAAWQSLNIITPFNFLLFYSLAIIHKKDVFKHKRYMIGTLFTIFGAISSRLLIMVFGASINFYAFFISEYFGLTIVLLLLLNDIRKKANPIPYSIIAVGLCINIFSIHARYTEVWQSVVRFIGDSIF
ncbi:MAG: hypothetical protein GW839_08515 [Flavobacteriales bacterium]|nr:hypothetical protein [Flavobacteriia bacterium]NCP53171.1 hypothetical protein [Flavobacteriales bacterium]NCP60328.1 hypothetical protein [Flavobacteriales bacterium]NCQ15514.1 hypothetical protein [Flavobacteriales bacterium]PIV94566.1 MAG: hypothetical protein COW44_03505 [Flavobacteriaceae bacterium CG17_big_fil_post_rev_8_21_14_2_50_33_15]